MINPDLSPIHESVSADLRRGYYFKAFDKVMANLDGISADPELQRAAVLALLWGGARGEAETLYKRFNLASKSDEDSHALAGRLLKARIFDLYPNVPASLYKQAAEHYFETYQLTQGGYSGVNAATLFYLAGDKQDAAVIAQDLLKLTKPNTNAQTKDHYYYHATRAECFVILGDSEKAEKAMHTALNADPLNFTAHASTLKQFSLLFEGDLPDWVIKARPPAFIHFSGHMFSLGSGSGRRQLTLPESEAFKAKIIDRMQSDDIGAGIGALAAGSDILFAEALLETGADLHIVLPVPVADFRRLSVSPLGAEWELRFDAAMAMAKSIRIVRDDPGDFDMLDVKMASHLAMGLAQLMADRMSTRAFQYTLMDPVPPEDRHVGTWDDVQVWQATGASRRQFDWPHPVQKKAPANLALDNGRACQAMLFTDLKGYGLQPDRQIPDLVDDIFAPMAACCDALDEPPISTESWGDGLFLVFDNIIAACRAAFALRGSFSEAIAARNQSGSAPGRLAIRIGAHYGPVWQRVDPFTKRPNFYGGHVTRAARLEEIAVPGSIFISESFAAMLRLHKNATGHEFACDYVGRVLSDKDEREAVIYSLRKTKV